MPRAFRRHRALRTIGLALCTDGRAEIEHRLIPTPSLSLGHRSVGVELRLLGVQRLAGPASKDASGVHVDNAYGFFEGEHEDGPGCVGPESGQRQQLSQVTWQRATVVVTDGNCAAMQVECASVVTHPMPRGDDGRLGRVRARRRRRELLEERLPDRHHASDLCLLQHHFAHEDRPRIASVAPGQITRLVVGPPEEPTLPAC